MDFEKVGFESMDWIDLALKMDRRRALVTAVIKRRLP
jgi:hypothetical protein